MGVFDSLQRCRNHGWGRGLRPEPERHEEAAQTDLALLLPGRPLTLLDLVAHLAAKGAGAGLVGLELLPDDGEVGLVGGEAQHDQVS